MKIKISNKYSKNFCLFLQIFFLIGGTALALPDNAVRVSMTIKVSSPDLVSEQLITKAEKEGGYFYRQTENSVSINIPEEKTLSFITFAAKKGIVVDKKYNAEDLSGILQRKEISLKSKENVLKKYLEVLENADQSGIITVEKAVIKITGDIERLKGSIRYLKHQLKYANINFNFRFRDRSMPVSQGTSPFKWLNTMNLQDMIQDFQNEK